jgi:CubicO group peptidase (beta-lactamase class C family)
MRIAGALLAFFALVAARPVDLDAMDKAIAAGRFGKVKAVLVQRGGERLFERYYDGATAETRIDARSAGKSITALAVGAAIDDGLIAGVGTAAFPLLDHDALDRRAIAIRDLLSMSSALDCDDWRDSPGNEERMYRTRDWTRFALDIPIDANFTRDAAGQGRFRYCTAGAFLLGRIVERAAKQPFDAFVQRRLFDPLGIVGAVWRRSPIGEVQSGGQLSLRARDFAAIGQLVLDRGMHDGRALVSRDWLREMLRVRVQAGPRDGYAYLWWVRDFREPGKARPWPGFFMQGNGGNKVLLFPDLDAVVVLLAANYNRRDQDMLSTSPIEQHILPALIAAAP